MNIESGVLIIYYFIKQKRTHFTVNLNYFVFMREFDEPDCRVCICLSENIFPVSFNGSLTNEKMARYLLVAKRSFAMSFIISISLFVRCAFFSPWVFTACINSRVISGEK
jgi:hypothetical protein